MAQPGDVINLESKTADALAHESMAVLLDLERDHADSFARWEAEWDWYQAIPMSPTRNEPWPNASNVVMPVIRTFADAITSRLWGRMHTPTRTWMVKGENEELLPLYRSIEEWINADSRLPGGSFDVMGPTFDWVNETVVLGRSTLMIGWGTRQGFRWAPGRQAPTRVLISRGPTVSHIPAEQILWERDKTIAESSTVIRSALVSWSELVASGINNGWDEEVINGLMGESGIEGPTGRALDHKRENEGQAAGSGYQDPHDIREVWIDWAQAQLLARRPGNVIPPELMKAGMEQVPIVLTVHRKTRKLLRARAHPFFFDRWPFLDITYRRIPGRSTSPGVASILEHIQRSITTSVNQSNDAVSFGNSLKLLTQDSKVKNQKFRPNQPFFVDNLSDIKEINIGTPIIPNIQLINLMFSNAERVLGISDPNLGRETRLGGHPSPATNTLVQLQEGAKVLTSTMRLMRTQLATAGEWILSLYQQFDLRPGDRFRRRLGEADAERLENMFVSGENFTFDVHALSESVNPETERNAAILVDQATTQYYSFVMQMLTLLGDKRTAQIPGFQDTVKKAIEDKSKMLQRILQSTDIDDPESFGLALRGGRLSAGEDVGQFGRAVGEAFSGGNGQGNGPEGAVQGQGVGAVPGGNGQGVPVGAPGVGDGLQLG